MKESFLRTEILNRLKNADSKESSFLLTREQVIEYLKFWSRTRWNGSGTIDVISYEELIYFEVKFKDDKEIQNLISILKENIASLYELKAKWLDNLIDKNLLKNPKVKRTLTPKELYLYQDAKELEEEKWK